MCGKNRKENAFAVILTLSTIALLHSWFVNEQKNQPAVEDRNADDQQCMLAIKLKRKFMQNNNSM